MQTSHENMSSKTKTREIVVNKAEVNGVVDAAKYAASELAQFHRNHGVSMPVSEEQMVDHQALLILRGQDSYRAALVDDYNRVHHELILNFRRKNGGYEL